MNADQHPAAPQQSWGICFGPASGLSIGQLSPLARQAEAAGFDSVWTGEFGNDCLAWVQAFAHATNHCRVGSSIVNVFLRHPAVVAAGAATIDELSGSRLVLGLGTSHRSIVEESLGLAMARPLDYLEEYVQVVRAILSGELVYHNGTYFDLQGFRLEARPVRAHLPVYVAALGLVAAERAGRYADGVILTLTPPAYTHELIERLRAGASSAGRDPDAIEVVQIVPCFVSDHREAAQAAARSMICRYTGLPFYSNMFANAGFQREVARIREVLAAGQAQRAEDAVSLPMLEELAPVGDAAACHVVTERYRRAGVHSVVLYPNAVDAGWYEAIRLTLERCAPIAQ